MAIRIYVTIYNYIVLYFFRVCKNIRHEEMVYDHVIDSNHLLLNHIMSIIPFVKRSAR